MLFFASLRTMNLHALINSKRSSYDGKWRNFGHFGCDSHSLWRKRLPEFAQSLGKGIREFKKACQGEEENDLPEEIKQRSSQPTTALPPHSSQDPS